MEWLFPLGYIPLNAETGHLIYQADANKVCLRNMISVILNRILFCGREV